MIDVANENLVPLGQVPTIVPSSHPGKRLNIATVWRWATHGVRGVQLESILIGGARYTSREAVARFVDALNGTRDGAPAAPVPTPARRQRQRERAARVCDAAGIN